MLLFLIILLAVLIILKYLTKLINYMHILELEADENIERLREERIEQRAYDFELARYRYENTQRKNREQLERMEKVRLSHWELERELDLVRQKDELKKNRTDF